MAENDALVELIQTTEYLEVHPTWGKKDYHFYHPRYGDPFYRGRGRGRGRGGGRGRGRREWVGERMIEREANQGFGRGSSDGNGRGNGRGFHSQAPLERNQRDRQEEEWSTPASDGRRGRDIPASSPTVQGSEQRTPPTPAPSEDKFFIDWSSIGTGSHLVRTPPQSVLVRERGQEINQPTVQTSQPGSEPIQMGVTEIALQGDLIVTTPTTQQQPLDRLSVMDERRMNDIGTNTLDVEVEPNGDRSRTSTVEVNTHTSILIVDILLPSGHGNYVKIPHVNLSITGYEPDSLRPLVGTRSPSMRTHEISAIPQMDGPRSLPRREPHRGQMNEVPRLA